MILTYLKTLPYWFPLLFAYLLIGGFSALKPRLAWLPLMFIIPLTLLSLQASLVMSLSHDYQLMVLLSLLAGIALGGSVLRPRVLQVLPKFMFALDGEWTTLALVLTIFTIKTALGFCGAYWPEDAMTWQCLSALIGALVPGAFLGRAIFLASQLRSTTKSS